MQDAVLIQAATGSHDPLLRLTHGHHALYAERHRMDFWCVYEPQQRERPPHWDKLWLIQKALDAPQPYRWIFWLDADTVITEPEQDLRAALAPDKDFGLVINPHPYHFNSGAIYLRSSEATREFLHASWSHWPVNGEWQEQLAINRVLESRWFPGFRVLPATWNSSSVNEVLRPIVRAWHGAGSVQDRLEGMQKALREVRE